MLNELERELEHREDRFVRYEDDSMIFYKGQKIVEMILRKILPFIEKTVPKSNLEENTDGAYQQN